jgi:hypothetical protein
MSGLVGMKYRLPSTTFKYFFLLGLDNLLLVAKIQDINMNDGTLDAHLYQNEEKNVLNKDI